MADRDPAEFHEASHWPDPSAACDDLSSHVAELVDEEWPTKADPAAKKAVIKLVSRVVGRLMNEGRMGPLVDVQRLPGRELLARLIDEILAAQDKELMVRCIDFVFETGVQLGISETEIGRICRVTKSTVSNYCVHLKEVYRNGVPAAGMKSKQAVNSYRVGRTGRSSRSARIEWPFANIFAENYARAS